VRLLRQKNAGTNEQEAGQSHQSATFLSLQFGCLCGLWGADCFHKCLSQLDLNAYSTLPIFLTTSVMRLASA